jgi:protein-tyrosine phosphatase
MPKTDRSPLRLAAFVFGLVLAAPVARAAPAIPFQAASVSSADGRVFTIDWDAPGVRQVRIYAGTDPRRIGHERLVAHGPGRGEATVAALPAQPRWYFELAPDRGQSLVVADRSLHLTTAGNFRDIGGYRTMDGKWVRMGVAYRSNGLEHLTPAESAAIRELHLKLITDLRTDEERRRGPDRAPDGVPDLQANVLADDAAMIHAMMTHTAPPAATRQSLMQPGGIYRDFVSLGSARAAYHQTFEGLADATDAPSVFHCTAGKDRTGWADAVLLTILGVPRATILADYQLTDVYLQGAALASVRQQFGSGAVPAGQAPKADPADLDAAFDEVTRRYGSFDNYLHQGLGLDDKTLRAIRRNFLVG